MSLRPVIRLIVADDHPLTREGLCAIVSTREDMCVVGQASNGEEAVNLYRLHRPDVLLMDMYMPKMDGVQTTRSLQAEFPLARVVIFSVSDGDAIIFQAMQAGARGYLLKDAPATLVLDTIKAVADGEICLSPELAAKVARRLHLRDLSDREQEVLEQIVAGKSNSEIASTLFICEGTVKSHVNSLLAKLKVADRTQAAMTAIERGLVPIPSLSCRGNR